MAGRSERGRGPCSWVWSLLASLRRLLEEDDAEELRRAAHTPKSIGAAFGADHFGQLWRDLEERAESREFAGASEFVARIEQEYGLLGTALVAQRVGAAS